MSEKEYDELAKTLANQGSLALHEKHPDLEQLRIGLSWDPVALTGQPVDMDLAALLLTDEGKPRGADDLVFYNHKKSSCHSVRHLGDDRTGTRQQGEKDDETLLIDLSLVPDEIEKIAVIVSIHKGGTRQQNFGLVRGAAVRLFNEGKSGDEIAKLDLAEDVALATAAVIGELQRRQKGNTRDWTYVRMGMGDEGGLKNLLLDYGVGS